MSMSDLVSPLKRQTLSSDVYDQLKELVMTGRMMPGEQMSLRTVAAALGVSVMPVRDAMQRLVAEQALEVTPNRAMRVPMMTVSQFREITTIRLQLEGLATELSAVRIDDEEFAKVMLWHENFAQEMAKTKPDAGKLIAANKALHFAVYHAAKMPMLIKMIDSLWLRIGPILNYDLRSSSRRVGERIALSHHERWVLALKKKNGKDAREALQGDIESAADYIISAGVLVSAENVTKLTSKITTSKSKGNG